MSSRRRRSHGGGGHQEAHADERWLVSYADMITVLMCLFLVLFAMSSIDADKYAQLKDSLATGFGTISSKTVDSAVGVIVEPEYVDEEGVGFASAVAEQTSLQKAEAEVADFQELIAQVTANLSAAGVQDQVEFEIDERGLTIKLVGGQTYFAGDSAELQDAAITAIDAVGVALTPTSSQISVEGHIDPYGSGSPRLNEWNLAADRSTAVLRHLVEGGMVSGSRISSVSFGGYHPVVAAKSALNRRVDIVVHTSLSGDAAALVPEVVAQTH